MMRGYYCSSSVCPVGWIPYGKSCFLVVLNESTLAEARDDCLKRGARLAEVVDEKGADSNKYLLHEVMADAYQKRFLLHEELTVDHYRHSTYTQCNEVNARSLLKVDCSNPLNFICRSGMVAEIPDCESVGGMHFFSSCMYKTIENGTRDEAKARCALQKGHLLDISDRYKASLARVIVMKDRNSFWVGNSPQEDSECMMVGLGDDNEPEFKWSTSGCSNITAYAICEVAADLVPQTTLTTTPRITTTITIATRPLLCPDPDWKSLKDSCYWETSYETSRMSWDEARRFCGGYGGDLASYSSYAEEVFALGSAFGMIRGSWIGLKRYGTGNEFRWSDGSPLNYSRWATGQPQLSSHMNCVAQVGLKSEWYVNYCGTRRWFVCKVPKVSNPKRPSEPQIEPMPKCLGIGGEEWYYNKEYCYNVQVWQAVAWRTAKLYCEDHSARLLSVHSLNETNFILRLLETHAADNYWLGLSSHGLRSPFLWTDGTSLDFINWKEDVDLQTRKLDRCVQFNSLSGFWEIGHCNMNLPFICKRKFRGTSASTNLTTPAPRPRGFCPNMWYVFGDQCYKPFGFQLSEKLSWQEAHIQCSKLGGSLAVIHSAEQQDFLLDLVLEIGYEAWIGMKFIWDVSLFEWVDGSLIDYVNWYEGEPYNFITKENCVEMLFSKDNDKMGKWNDVDCNKTKGYICQRDKDPSLDAPGENPSSCPLMKDWGKLSTSCYKIFLGSDSWLGAQSQCRKYNATLTSVDNFGVSLFLKRLSSEMGQHLFWIGVRELEKDSYRSFALHPLHYSNWAPGQPRRLTERSNCVAINSKSQWIVTDCDAKLPFLCQFLINRTDTSPSLDEGVCPNGSQWHNIKGPSCFMFAMTTLMSWNSAVQKCFYYGGALASFHSKSQLDLIAPFVRGASGPLFIGLGRKHDGSYRWLDGSPVDFVNWDIGEPNSDEENCVEMHTDVLTWNDIPCTAARGYICSVPKVPIYDRNTNKKIDDHRKSAKRNLDVSGIVGIIVCSMVVMVVAAVFFYYTCPKTSLRTRALSEPETPLFECSSRDVPKWK